MSPGVVGPNAVIQLACATQARLGAVAVRDLFAGAGHVDLLDNPPGQMIDERIPADLFGVLRGGWPDDADEILADAGTRTADYVIANRIPRPAQIVLGLVPRRIGVRLLLQAIRRNAWTFVGSGTCRVMTGPLAVRITGNPLSTPGNPWHRAVFARLFGHLVAPGTIVRVKPVTEGEECYQIVLPA